MAYGAIIVINSNKFIVLFNCFDWNDEPFSIFVLAKSAECVHTSVTPFALLFMEILIVAFHICDSVDAENDNKADAVLPFGSCARTHTRTRHTRKIHYP